MCQMEVIIRLKGAEGQTLSETPLTTQTFNLSDVDSRPRAERLDRLEDASDDSAQRPVPPRSWTGRLP